ncbi:c-type cytochrome [Synechocystis sp. PCC 7339]|uniref:c-type cytochrome n=1 Tax=unclassified Synechocystis TaxID=2640012 RepID=UPI001BAFD91D|nr:MULTISPECIES: c-type cytochrome [unclassified Synechocystis]QUS61254.1 c-type cytochrome [Synechocystis sp. PCC 7338]UAJ73441.1 c-type cytochrome [Synechocystis sp. PCC 7339]
MFKLFNQASRIFLGIALPCLIFLGGIFSLGNTAFAADLAHGKAIFAGNCAACHNGGLNSINPSKTLKMADLEANGKNSVAAIVAQITNGNGAMPGFKGRISDSDMEDVATYVLDQAEKGW